VVRSTPPIPDVFFAPLDYDLSTAYVLLTETRDGYAHRLRAIGHLHEAENVSQTFAVLHAAICGARKTSQPVCKIAGTPDIGRRGMLPVRSRLCQRYIKHKFSNSDRHFSFTASGADYTR